MTCENYGNVVVCRPTIWGLGEARDLHCGGCRTTTRHWAFITNDAWYDPEHFWRCGECGRAMSKWKAPRVTWPPLHMPPPPKLS